MSKVEIPFEDIIKDVHTFMATGQANAVGTIVGVPDLDTLKLGHRLINEEVNTETLALLQDIIDEKVQLTPEIKALFLDHIVDSVYVLMWLAVALGFHRHNLFWDSWREVQLANMDKFRNGVIRNAMGKIQKPEGWEAPDEKIKQRFFEASHLEYCRSTPGVLATNESRKEFKDGTGLHSPRKDG